MIEAITIVVMLETNGDADWGKRKTDNLVKEILNTYRGFESVGAAYRDYEVSYSKGAKE